MNKTYLIGLVVVAIIAISGFFRGGVVTERVVERLGGAAGPVLTEHQEYKGGQTLENTVATSTTVTSYTLLANDLVNRGSGAAYDTIIFTPNTGDLTLTFPASSTLPHFISRAGYRTRQCWFNATSTAGIDITFAAGTGIDVQTSSSTPSDLILRNGQFGCFDFVRKPVTSSAFDIGVLWTKFQVAD